MASRMGAGKVSWPLLVKVASAVTRRFLLMCSPYFLISLPSRKRNGNESGKVDAKGADSHDCQYPATVGWRKQVRGGLTDGRLLAQPRGALVRRDHPFPSSGPRARVRSCGRSTIVKKRWRQGTRARPGGGKDR